MLSPTLALWHTRVPWAGSASLDGDKQAVLVVVGTWLPLGTLGVPAVARAPSNEWGGGADQPWALCPSEQPPPLHSLLLFQVRVRAQKGDEESSPYLRPAFPGNGFPGQRAYEVCNSYRNGIVINFLSKLVQFFCAA